jgi:hypothetical protein
MVEKAQYDVLKQIDDIEIRSYPEMFLAVVEGFKEDSGFSILFDYISGNNTTQQKIQMTIPVITSEKIPMTAPVITKDRYIAFILPSQYSKDTVPLPKNSNVKIQFQNAKTYAVQRFSGKTPPDRVKQYIDNLYGVLKHNKISIKNIPILMRYNSPFAPGFIRRNEVAVEVDLR